MINEELERIRQYAQENNVPIMRRQSAELLSQIVIRQQPKSILEIGTAIGYSAILMLLNSPCSKLITIEKDENRVETAKQNFDKLNLSNRVQIICDDVYTALPLLSGQFDFVLLDGPKGHYSELFDHIDGLLQVGGGVLIDDVKYHGWVNDGTYPQHKHRTIIINMRRFISKLNGLKNYQMTEYDIEDGLIYMRKTK